MQLANSEAFQFDSIVLTPAQTAGAWITGFISLIGAILNALIFVLLLGNRQLRTVQGAFIGSLTVADMLLCATASPTLFMQAPAGRWVIGWVGCRLQAVTTVGFCCASIMSIGMISLDRYFVVVKRQRFTALQATIILAISWVYAIVLGGLALDPAFGSLMQSAHYYCTGDWITNRTYPLLCAITISVALLGMVYVYWAIWRIVSIAHQRTAGAITMSAAEEREAAERKLASRFVLLVVCFMICWSPYLVAFLHAVFKRELAGSSLDIAAAAMAFVNSSINPVLYAILDRRFGETFYRLIHCQPLTLRTTDVGGRTSAPSETAKEPLILATADKAQRRVSINAFVTAPNTSAPLDKVKAGSSLSLAGRSAANLHANLHASATSPSLPPAASAVTSKPQSSYVALPSSPNADATESV